MSNPFGAAVVSGYGLSCSARIVLQAVGSRRYVNVTRVWVDAKRP